MLVQLKSKEIKPLREEWLEEQKGECPILGKVIKPENATLDHLHKLKSEAPNEEGLGCCRGVLHAKANAWEGKVTNSFRRVGMHNEGISLPDALRNLANYLENNKLQEETKYIHPSEKPKPNKITKGCYNQLVKASGNTVPKYGSGVLTIRLEKLLKSNQITIKYYK